MTERSSTAPELAVIIACYHARDTVAACLESLERQRPERSLDTVLVESSHDGTAELVRQRFPWVRLIERNERCYAGDARNIALQTIDAPLIAFVDADCVLPENWAERVITAHRDDHLVIGGVIDNAAADSVLAWGYYFLEFNLWLPGREAGEIDEIAGCCLSMKREAYDRYGPFLAGTYCSDTEFLWRLRSDGHRVLHDPNIRVFHNGRMPLVQFLAHTVTHRSHFARVLSRHRRLGLPSRLAHATLCFALPPALLAAITLRVARAGVYRWRLLAATPVVALGTAARAWGELLGFLTPQQR